LDRQQQEQGQVQGHHQQQQQPTAVQYRVMTLANRKRQPSMQRVLPWQLRLRLLSRRQ
jgi:hypothetical protein